jgi:AMMECR1 domain-containing protein
MNEFAEILFNLIDGLEAARKKGLVKDRDSLKIIQDSGFFLKMTVEQMDDSIELLNYVCKMADKPEAVECQKPIRTY